jgi:hypothetical protein
MERRNLKSKSDRDRDGGEGRGWPDVPIAASRSSRSTVSLFDEKFDAAIIDDSEQVEEIVARVETAASKSDTPPSLTGGGARAPAHPPSHPRPTLQS